MQFYIFDKMSKVVKWSTIHLVFVFLFLIRSCFFFFFKSKKKNQNAHTKNAESVGAACNVIKSTFSQCLNSIVYVWGWKRVLRSAIQKRLKNLTLTVYTFHVKNMFRVCVCLHAMAFVSVYAISFLLWLISINKTDWKKKCIKIARTKDDFQLKPIVGLIPYASYRPHRDLQRQ